MVHFVVLLFLIYSLSCYILCLEYSTLTGLDALCCVFCRCCSTCTAVCGVGNIVVRMLSVLFGGGYSSWLWFTYNLYRESYPGVKRSSSSDLRSEWSRNTAAPVCRQDVLLGDLYPCFGTLVGGWFCDASCLCGRASGVE
jgi:hypothetical protein